MITHARAWFQNETIFAKHEIRLLSISLMDCLRKIAYLLIHLHLICMLKRTVMYSKFARNEIVHNIESSFLGYHANDMKLICPSTKICCCRRRPRCTLDKFAINFWICFDRRTSYTIPHSVSLSTHYPQSTFSIHNMQFLYKRDTFCVTHNNRVCFLFLHFFLLLLLLLFSFLFLYNIKNTTHMDGVFYKWNEDARVFYSIYSKHDNSTLTTSF